MNFYRTRLIRQLRKSDPFLILLLLLGLFALTPLAAPGYFYAAHDGQHSVFYLIMFDASIRDGALWPRWAMHHIQGYGYPTFVIQAPIGFYIAELFVLLGAGYTLAAKLTWAVGFLAGGWGMYALVIHWLHPAQTAKQQQRRSSSRLLNINIDIRLAAAVAALAYIYIPYHLTGIYVRAALNDTLLFAWFPWVFLAFDKLIADGLNARWQSRLALAMLTLAGTLLTHTFALISFVPLLITFVLFRLWSAWTDAGDGDPPISRPWQHLRTRVLLAATAGIGALFLAATFILPLLVEGQHLQQQVYTTNTYDFRRHFVYIGQFFSPFWGFGFSDDPTGANDGMGFQVGVLPLITLIVAASLALYDRLQKRPSRPESSQPQSRRSENHRSEKRIRRLSGYLILAAVALLYLITPYARPLWEVATPLAVIQFPWRLLSLVAFILSALLGLTLRQIFDLYDATERKRIRSANCEISGGYLIFGLLAIFASWSLVGANLDPIQPWREDGRAIFRFEQKHPDMIAETEWVKNPIQQSPMTPNYASEEYVEDYTEAGPLERLAIVQGKGRILSRYSRGSTMGGVVEMEEDGVVRVHVLFFPGWQATVDGRIVPHRVSDPYGLVEFDVPAGEHQIELRMGATPTRTLGTIISLSTLLATLGLVVWSRLRGQEDKKRGRQEDRKTGRKAEGLKG